MPIFEFECRDCHEVAEIFVTPSRPPVCPKCGGKHLEKHLSLFATNGPAGSAAGGAAGGKKSGGGCGCGHCGCGHRH
ncbi:MAG: hypothetical protein LBR07_03545 [Puniceicoccales bacterium]|nr:hypothetical protein [Puniceicoccales bacterium]